MRENSERRDRGVTTVVGKVLEIGIVVLYVGLLATALYGGAVPDYRTAAGERVADRALAAAAHRVESAVPAADDSLSVRVRARADLPDTIRGQSYTVRADDRGLVLDHPHPAVGDRGQLVLPDGVVRVEGSWESTEPAAVVVESRAEGLVVELQEEEP